MKRVATCVALHTHTHTSRGPNPNHRYYPDHPKRLVKITLLHPRHSARYQGQGSTCSLSGPMQYGRKGETADCNTNSDTHSLEMQERHYVYRSIRMDAVIPSLRKLISLTRAQTRIHANTRKALPQTDTREMVATAAKLPRVVQAHAFHVGKERLSVVTEAFAKPRAARPSFRVHR